MSVCVCICVIVSPSALSPSKIFCLSVCLLLVTERWTNASMLEYSMMDCMFSRYIYPANGS